MNALRPFTDPIALDRSLTEKCSPIKVDIIGVTIPEANPMREKAIIIIGNVGANVQLKAAII